jgi:hypothetical protein
MIRLIRIEDDRSKGEWVEEEKGVSMEGMPG